MAFRSLIMTLTVLPAFSFAQGPTWCIAYAPFRPGQAPGSTYPTTAQVIEDLSMLRWYTTHIRTYSTDNGFDQIVSWACQFGMTVTPGAWIAHRTGSEPPDAVQALDAADRREVDGLVNLANGSSNVQTVIVGNEVPLAQKAAWIAWIQEVQSRVPATIDVTCAAGPLEWLGNPDLVQAVDSIMLNAYPFWGGIHIDAAPANLLSTITQLRTAYPGKRIIVGETGWPTAGSASGEAAPSIANQYAYITGLVETLGGEDGLEVFLHEAFDQEWKVEPFGVGPHWGIWNSDRTPKHTNALFPVPRRFGDVNGDTSADAVDVQIVINAALGVSTQGDAHLNCDNDVDASDVQLTINAALGLYDASAKTTPLTPHGPQSVSPPSSGQGGHTLVS